MVIEVEFGECEHYGDLDMYCDGMARHGARIIKAWMPCPEYAEVGIAQVEVRDEAQWNECLNDEDVGGFHQGWREVKC